MLVTSNEIDWSAYTAVTGVTELSHDAMQLFQLRWDLTEIVEYTIYFNELHEESKDTEEFWKSLSDSAAALSDLVPLVSSSSRPSKLSTGHAAEGRTSL